MSGSSKEWFSDWFNSPYYHILYKHRDDEEAKHFIDLLCEEFSFRSENKILDVACGRGRHAIYLNEKGFKVAGIDLSEENIKYASQFENSNLKFYVHDMRDEFQKEEFDFIINLFTSFGYFENEEDNYKSLAAFAKSMKRGGRLIIDFMNTGKIVAGLVPEENREIDGIHFSINRKVYRNFIVKNIEFEDKGRPHHYCEKVRIISKEDFLKYFNFAKLSLERMFGNYDLDPFDPMHSDRMIFIVRKN